MIKVGDSAEVIEIVDSHYPGLYKVGDWGTVVDAFRSGNCSAFVGSAPVFSTVHHPWHVSEGTYKKVGKLTVTKIK